MEGGRSVSLEELEELVHSPSRESHNLVKELFSKEIYPDLKLAGRLSHFLMNWKKVKQDQGILSITEGYQIPFLREPVQSKLGKWMQLDTTE